MGYVRLRKIIFNDFRTFEGRHEVEFPLTGLMKVEGDNRDTRGRSAAGKTNLLLALQYLMQCCPVPAKALQCWHTKTPFTVEGYFDTHEGPMVYVRGPKKVSLKVGDEAELTTADSVDERLDRVCGANAKLREVLTYRSQVDPKHILMMGDTEIKKFLTEALSNDVVDLKAIESEIDRRAKDLKKLDVQAQSDKAVYDATEAAAAGAVVSEPVLEDEGRQKDVIATLQHEEEEAVKSIRAREAEADSKSVARQAAIQAEVAPMRAEAQALEQKQQELRAKLRDVSADVSAIAPIKRDIEEVDFHVARLKKQVEAAREEHERRCRALRADISREERAAGMRSIHEADKRRAQRSLEAAQQKRCPHCKQPWENEDVASLHMSLKTAEAGLLACDAADALVAQYNDRLRQLVFVPDPKLEKLQEIRQKLGQKLAAAEADVKSSLSLARAGIEREMADLRAQAQEKLRAVSERVSALELDPEILNVHKLIAEETSRKHQLSIQLVQARAGLQAIQQRNRQAQAVYEAAQRARQQLEESAAAAKKKWLRSKESFQVESDYLDMLRGFRSKIFDEVLGSIGEDANQVLSNLPNAQTAVIRFDSEKETQDGVVQQKITPVLVVDGVERPLKHTASGGQTTSLALATDLAFIRVVSARRGTNLGWIVLDESFDGHDQITKESCLEVLRSYASDKLVIIVDHASEFKELITKTVTVVHENGRSRIA